MQLQEDTVRFRGRIVIALEIRLTRLQHLLLPPVRDGKRDLHLPGSKVMHPTADISLLRRPGEDFAV